MKERSRENLLSDIFFIRSGNDLMSERQNKQTNKQTNKQKKQVSELWSNRIPSFLDVGESSDERVLWALVLVGVFTVII